CPRLLLKRDSLITERKRNQQVLERELCPYWIESARRSSLLLWANRTNRSLGQWCDHGLAGRIFLLPKEYKIADEDSAAGQGKRQQVPVEGGHAQKSCTG